MALTFEINSVGLDPLQCYFPKNPRDGGAWWPAVCGVVQSQTRLKRLSSSSMLGYISHKACWLFVGLHFVVAV